MKRVAMWLDSQGVPHSSPKEAATADFRRSLEVYFEGKKTVTLDDVAAAIGEIDEMIREAYKEDHVFEAAPKLVAA